MKEVLAQKKVLFEKSWFWFVSVFTLFLVHVLTSRFDKLYYDSYMYWYYAKSFCSASGFSLLNYNTELRGYLYPLIIYLATAFFGNGVEPTSEEIVALKLLASLCAAAIFGFIAPKLWITVAAKARLSWLSRGLFTLAGFLFWRDYFNFPLADFPAFLALLGAFLSSISLRNIIGALLAGALASAALYMRPLYILSLPFILALVLLPHWDMPNGLLNRKLVIATLFFIVGFLLVATPQIIINKYNFNNSSVLVSTNSPEYLVNGKPNLFLWHLNNGLRVQRYEINVGNDYPSPQVVFNDMSGNAMLSRSGVSTLNSIDEYMRFVLERPLDMTALYIRHTFNGLDILYPTPYLNKVHSKTFITAFFNYTYFFVALLILVFARKSLKLAHWLIIGAILLPSLASIPLTIECRFLMPLHLLICATACFGWPTHWHWRRLSRPQLFRLASAYATFLLICFVMSSNTQATLNLATKIIHP